MPVAINVSIVRIAVGLLVAMSLIVAATVMMGMIGQKLEQPHG
jgi:hypothetical protein